jgi:hypothetical protein
VALVPRTVDLPPELPLDEPEPPLDEPELPLDEPELPLDEPGLPPDEPELPLDEPGLPPDEPELPHRCGDEAQGANLCLTQIVSRSGSFGPNQQYHVERS